MDVALHGLCQPLTVLQCRLAMGDLIGEPEAMREAIREGLRGVCADEPGSSDDACDVATGHGGYRRREGMVSGMNMGRDAVLNEDVMEVAAVRTVVLASADAGLRQRLRASLTGLRWQVREASGGAEAMAQLEDSRSEALLVDSWLPDLEVGEFATVIRMLYPAMELLRVDGGADGGARSPRRNELLHALREAQNAPLNDTSAWAAAPE